MLESLLFLLWSNRRSENQSRGHAFLCHLRCSIGTLMARSKTTYNRVSCGRHTNQTPCRWQQASVAKGKPIPGTKQVHSFYRTRGASSNQRGHGTRVAEPNVKKNYTSTTVYRYTFNATSQNTTAVRLSNKNGLQHHGCLFSEACCPFRHITSNHITSNDIK